MAKLCWRPIKDGVIVPKVLYMPSKRRKPIDLLIDFDLFEQDGAIIDVILAVVASTGHTRFFYETTHLKKRIQYFRLLKNRGRIAAEKYEAQMRSHFRKYKHDFLEGYSLPEPPTPELRAIYDAAAQWELRPTNPCGTSLQSGWSLGECHWRDWPLSNLIDLNDARIAK